MLFQKKRRVVIAGSGPSLSQIDYKRFPHNAQIWRINDFFKEQNFFVGRRVDAIFSGGTSRDIRTRMNKIDDARGRYHINMSNIYTAMPINGLPHVKKHFDEIEKLSVDMGAPELASLLKYNSEIWDVHLFSGVAAIVLAILSGFDEIYLAGIDCDYESGPRYAYSSAKTGAKTLAWINSYHPTDFQWDVVRRYQQKFNAKIYSLSMSSPAAHMFSMAPRTLRKRAVLETKAIKDENI